MAPAARVGLGFDAHRFAADAAPPARTAAPAADAAPPGPAADAAPPAQAADAAAPGPAGRRSLRLALLEWPGEPALDGHSDGDVAVHALVDALATAAGLGDIGQLFGADRPEFAGANSTVFLAETVRLVRAAGFQIENATIQVVGARPRLAARRAEAERGIGQILGAPVTLAATTTDQMGFTGRGEGLAALAVCLLQAAAEAPPAGRPAQ
ncbi:MAG: 2-C-methyl-D-erythritol 2,4-cyclodiphosphate synthase [Bifidobacteriaceae bacterium]|jgi:2-C-methyl-D-erythritol 4-phosphate cytidylyltransferase/2-C-methyl-D-erythritol 2,4-cyclodiphosphate synthase|nr:2-C-methyl-D-erythritol 2,4-cyclodiphosphate synthase [Bifidobacteriaceae bacterium]